jgi:hypothetical protein
LLHASNPAVRRAVNDALEVVLECGGEGWHDRIMEKRFEFHNREWLQLMHEMAQQQQHALADEHGMDHHHQQQQQHQQHQYMGGGGGPQNMMTIHPDLADHLGGAAPQYYGQQHHQQHGGGNYDYDEEVDLSQSV